MTWMIRYSEEARQDLRDIYEYISYELLAPETAAAQYRRITEAIRKLDEMPLRFPLYEDEPWNSLGMRWLPVDNYLVFYFTDDPAKELSVARIMYRGRDVRRQLEEQEDGADRY